ncbi:hypothetical protein [Geopseudomonas aromaticivorans]
MTIQQTLSRHGPLLQEAARHPLTKVRSWAAGQLALFLLYRDDWEALNRGPCHDRATQPLPTPSSALIRSSMTALGRPEIALFLLGERPANVLIRAADGSPACILTIKSDRALIIACRPVHQLPVEAQRALTRAISEIDPAIARINTLVVSREQPDQIVIGTLESLLIPLALIA